MRIAQDFGPDEPVYRRLVELIAQTLGDVGLADDAAEGSVLQMAEEALRGICFVLFDRSYDSDETAFTDALMALLSHRAPLVNWYVVPISEDNAVTVIGTYPADMPEQSITVST